MDIAFTTGNSTKGNDGSRERPVKRWIDELDGRTPSAEDSEDR